MAKKKSSRTRGKVDPSQHERRQQRLEERRQAREQELARATRERRKRDFLRRALIVLVLGVLTWFFFFRSQSPTEIAGTEVMNFSTSGVNVHRTGSLEYETTPPVSGPHAPQPAACGTHAEPVSDEEQVHTLEHGGVGIQYLPDLDPEQIAAIEELASGYDSHVFSAPYSGMEPNVVVSSWGKKIELDSARIPVIRAYVTAFRLKGPEKQDCPSSSDETFSA
ncbi:MAG: DUF3105 domain-containing protein [Actinomycetota bacterium]|nr:DUF3105 domain-containing protein [Actinomycetota bacterium]